MSSVFSPTWMITAWMMKRQCKGKTICKRLKKLVLTVEGVTNNSANAEISAANSNLSGSSESHQFDCPKEEDEVEEEESQYGNKQ